MKKLISVALAFSMLATSLAALAGTSEARHRDRHYDNYYYYDHHNRDYDRRHRDRNNDAAAAAIIALALGAIIIGSQSNRRDRHDDGYRYRDSNWDHIRRCEARYRSYDRRTDTFIGRDGRRYYCSL